MKQLYFQGVQLHCSAACASTSTCIYIHMHVHLHSWLGLMTSEPKGLTKKSSQGENLFPCNKFISSCITMCIHFVAMTCIILYASKLKGLIKKLLPPREKFHAKFKSIVSMVYECYFFNQLLHCIGMACIIL